MEGRGRSMDEAGEGGRGREGTGGPLSHITDTPLTAQRTPDRGCSTADECRAMLQLSPA
jgi:hypothetical protein